MHGQTRVWTVRAAAVPPPRGNGINCTSRPASNTPPQPRLNWIRASRGSHTSSHSVDGHWLSSPPLPRRQWVTGKLRKEGYGRRPTSAADPFQWIASVEKEQRGEVIAGGKLGGLVKGQGDGSTW
ncbi:hypothetical protein L1887_57959 [Cichorium endivia]|nr:hypothetical protein L1887_57959 [Cichorium endivia]